MIGLYDANGNLVATNDNGASDRRNAKLNYNVSKILVTFVAMVALIGPMEKL